jgi:hypothetical protein
VEGTGNGNLRLDLDKLKFNLAVRVKLKRENQPTPRETDLDQEWQIEVKSKQGTQRIKGMNEKGSMIGDIIDRHDLWSLQCSDPDQGARDARPPLRGGFDAPEGILWGLST